MSNYRKHAEVEFKHAGWTNEDGSFKDEWQGLMCNQVLELLDLFSEHGHSGSTYGYALNLFDKLARFKPVTPLTGEDSEWTDHGGLFQNNRLSSVFKDKDIFNGQAYDIDGKVFWAWGQRDLEEDEEGYPGKLTFKSYYTSNDSKVPITFPYIPPKEPEYVYVCPDADDDYYIPQNEEGILP